MKINKINNINFKENALSSRMGSREASLMIQSQAGNVNFARERYIAEQMGSVNAQPLKSLGYKLYRTFGYLANHQASNSNKFNVVA